MNPSLNILPGTKSPAAALRSVAACLVAAAALFSCQKNQAADTVVTAPVGPQGPSANSTKAVWVDTVFRDPSSKEATLSAADLSKGGPSTPLAMTYAQANLPVALFSGGTKDNGSGKIVAPMPFLGFVVEAKTVVSVRHIKSVNGQNVDSAVVVPIPCPDSFIAAQKLQNGDSAYCLPLINIVIPSFLVPTDSSGAYVHEFIVSAKNPDKGASVLSSKVATTIIIPNSTLSVKPSADLAALSLSDRLTIATNDLVGSPRRDFKAFEIDGSIAPGVNTAWVLTFSNLQMTITEELFFEQPVVPGANPAKPSVSRGGGFYKRSSSINSINNFRLKVLDGYSDANNFNVASSSGAIVEIPITDGTSPLRIFLIPDFGSETATMSMSDYVKPFGPTFCPSEQAAFKPEEWRKSRSTPGYVACEATKRTRIVDSKDALAKGLTSPLETFFGSFSYLPRMGASTLGGTNGILSLRISLSGTLQAAVRNPFNQSTTTVVGTLPLAYSYQFPTVLTEISNLLSSGKSSPGLDTIQSAMARKGIFELPRKPGGAAGVTLPAFPFLGITSDSIFY